jgi:hypothetical protein
MKESFERDLESAAKIIDAQGSQQVSLERTKLFVDAFKHIATLTGAILAFVLTSIYKLPSVGPTFFLGFSLIALFVTLIAAVASLAQLLACDVPKYSLHAWQLRVLYFLFSFGMVSLGAYTTYGLFVTTHQAH